VFDLVGSLSPEELIDGIWAQVDRAFSEPVNDDLATAEYAPTQVIAEAFRRRGLDGLVYKSRLGTGFTIALFDLDAAKIGQRILFKTEGVDYRFTEQVI
jgi:hypothetical protein